MDAFIQRVRKTDLARNTHKIIRNIQRGQMVVVESHGQPEVAIIDIVDYHIQRAFIYYYSQTPAISIENGLPEKAVTGDDQQKFDLVISHYLAGSISLGRAAELLDIPWLALRTRFFQLGIPLRTSPEDVAEIKAEIEAVQKLEGEA